MIKNYIGLFKKNYHYCAIEIKTHFKMASLKCLKEQNSIEICRPNIEELVHKPHLLK
jgi:hypothetical protein